MKALNLHGIGDLRYDDVPLPKCERDEVLLKIRAVGICGSDIPRVFTKGTYHFPTIIGHEFAGEIVEAADNTLIGKGAVDLGAQNRLGDLPDQGEGSVGVERNPAGQVAGRESGSRAGVFDDLAC